MKGERESVIGSIVLCLVHSCINDLYLIGHTEGKEQRDEQNLCQKGRDCDIFEVEI